MASALKQAALGAVALISILGTARCRPDLCPEASRVNYAYKGECLGGIDYHVHRSRVEIYPHPQCPWEQLIDLGIFEGFRPGITISQARQRFGVPDVEATRGSARIWEYRRPNGLVQIGHEDQGSGIIPMYRWWVLRAYPDNKSPQAIFPPEIGTRLPNGKQRYEVVILNQCRFPMAAVTVENGEVQDVTWIDNPGSYGDDRGGKK